LGVLKPLWQEIPETASRLRGRIEAVLDFAKARGWRSGENPAAWRGYLALILPKRQRLSRGHHAAMQYRDLPEFVGKLREHRSVSAAAMALEFAILTAARTGEVLGARWAEFDLENKIWTIPAARMKSGREHRVPLSARQRRSSRVLRRPRRASSYSLGSAGTPLCRPRRSRRSSPA
jgi:integrase